MTNTFLISDLHLKHKKIVEFTRNEPYRPVKTDVPLRPWDVLEDHDREIIERWNSVVREQDEVWVLGDVTLGKGGLELVDKLNGHKYLVPGNHDEQPAETLLKHFEKVRAIKEFQNRGWVCTHIPIHPSQVDFRWKINVHGHLHDNVINDPRYINVGAEQVNFTPIHIDELEKSKTF
jgi:calcineurin-like phosphoesterase family protein